MLTIHQTDTTVTIDFTYTNGREGGRLVLSVDEMYELYHEFGRVHGDIIICPDLDVAPVLEYSRKEKS